MARFLSIFVLLLAFSQVNAQPSDPGAGPCDNVAPGDLEQCLRDNAGSGGSGTIPEPGTLALFGLGIVAVGYMSRKRRK